MADTKDKAFEGAEKDEAVKAEASASAGMAESGSAGESKPAKSDEGAEGKSAKKDKAFSKTKIKEGDFVIYESTHGNRCVQVLEVSDTAVTVVGDEGARVQVSLGKVKKAN